MFGAVELFGTPESSIVVQTRQGESIANAQAPEPSERCFKIFDLLVHRHPGWLVRRRPTGLYNCAGHVWACRRTAIYEQSAWEQIFREDGYRVRTGLEQPTVGDLVVYRDNVTQALLHVGEIVELRRVAAGQGPDERAAVPWVLSKFGPTSGEVLHHYRQAPYEQFDVATSFWTEVPE